MAKKMTFEQLQEKASERHEGSALDAFQDNQNTITHQMAYINTQLEAISQKFADKPRDWGYVGSQGYVMERLNEIIGFLGPIEFPKIIDPAADGRRAARESGE